MGHEDPDMFFNPRKKIPVQRVCEECPVKAECHEEGLAHAEEWGGWWGGVWITIPQKYRKALWRERGGEG